MNISYQLVVPREAKVGGGVWHEYILLLKKKKKKKKKSSVSMY